MQLFDTTPDLDALICQGKFVDTPFDAHRHEDGKGIVIIVPYGRLYYAPHYFDEQTADAYLDYFLASQIGGKPINHRTHNWHHTDLNMVQFSHIHWQQDTIKMYGKNAQATTHLSMVWR